MSKYYYNDPLKAAWMMQEFDFKFFALHSDEQMSEYDLQENERKFDWLECCSMDFGTEIISIEEAFGFIKSASGKIYIHPDCHEMLKPQDGDIGSDGDSPARFERGAWRSDEYIDMGVDTYAIIQRNGNAFFMPEVENDEE